MVSLAQRRQAATYLERAYGASERRVCRVLGLARNTKRREAHRRAHDRALGTALHQLSVRYPRFGYRKVYVKLREQGWKVGRERVRLLRKREGLQVVREQKKRRAGGRSTAMSSAAQAPNHVWSYDFLQDQTAEGKRLKVLTVLDEFTREGLALHCARHVTSGDVIQLLSRLFTQRGTPLCLKSDNGPEFIAAAIQRWLAKAHVQTRYIDPGKPWQNGHTESFHAVIRDSCLNRWLFLSVPEARAVTTAWLHEYNTERPHGALHGLTPAAFALRWRGQQKLTIESNNGKQPPLL
jgi:putative transposase